MPHGDQLFKEPVFHEGVLSKEMEDDAVSAAERFEWNGRSGVHAACPVCGVEGAKDFRVRSYRDVFANTDHDAEGAVDFYSCTDCRSVFPHPFTMPEYKDDYGHPDWTRVYVQLWAGIEFITRPIGAVHRVHPISTFVDVGCGFGYTVDFAEKILGARSIGLDPSAYAADGARMLGVDIRQEYLGTEPLPGGMRADMLFCSEVIEHVDDPKGFVQMMRGHLQSDGVLALTTPDSAVVHPNGLPTLIMLALFPGFHRQIFSAHSLSNLLRTVGFKHEKVIQLAGRLMAFASDDPAILAIELNPDSEGYLKYLRVISESADPECEDVRQGGLYRLLAHCVAYGLWKDAERILGKLEKILRHDYPDLSLSRPEGVAAKLAPLTCVHDMPKVMPYWLPYALYHAGMYNLHGRSDLQRASRLLAGSHASIAHALRLGLAAEVTLHWLAVMHEGIALSGMNDCIPAVALFDRLIAASAEMPADLWQAELGPDLVARAYAHRGVALTRLGEPEKAASDFESALRLAALLPTAERDVAERILSEIRARSGLRAVRRKRRCFAL